MLEADFENCNVLLEFVDVSTGTLLCCDLHSACIFGGAAVVMPKLRHESSKRI